MFEVHEELMHTLMIHNCIIFPDLIIEGIFLQSSEFKFRLPCQPVDRSKGGTKKTPPLSWSTRVNQEGGGAQIYIKAKNGKGQTQF